MARNALGARGSGTMEIRVLGPVTGCRDGVDIDMGHARQRAVLALLAVRAGRASSVSWLVEQLWSQPPPRARETLYSYLSRLRRLLADSDFAIERHANGYLLAADPELIDLHRFRRLTARARRGGTLADWDAALALWRGEPFAGIDVPLLDRLRATLDAQWLAACLDRADLLIATGDPGAVLPDLRSLTGRYPWDQALAARLITALHHGGRTSEALEHYQRLATRLITERGVEPGAELVKAHREILTPRPVAPPVPTPTTVVPRQLPNDTAGFTGRAGQLRRLDALPRRESGFVAAVTGTAGSGKTALAVHWAHRVAAEFADGQLYVNLRGFDPGGQVVTPQEAIRGFLDGLGVAANRIPDDPADQTALFRRLAADKRLLVVIDNARDAAHARPLLPGGDRCLTVVTSRTALTGLTDTEATAAITVAELPLPECRNLLARRLGPDRLGDAASRDALIEACARLPLALTVVAARAATDPGLSVTDLLAELRDERSRLDGLDAGDAAADLRSVFSWSYQALSPDAARAFRALGLHPGETFTASVLANLLGVATETARTMLTELHEAHLIEWHVGDRDTLHDLLRTYARDLARDGDDTAAATRRLVDYHLHTALAAVTTMDPLQNLIAVAAPVPGVHPDPHTDAAAARRWFAVEHRTLLGVVDAAAEAGLDTRVWQLAWALGRYFAWSGNGRDWVRVLTAALAAARRLGDRTEQARVHRDLGRAYAAMQDWDRAAEHLHQTIELDVSRGDTTFLTTAHLTFATMYNKTGRHDLALEHNRKALQLYRAKGFARGEALALNNIGWTLACLGEYEEAQEYCQQSLRMHTETGHLFGQGTSWDSLGYIHYNCGRYELAVECYTTALKLSESGIGERYHHTRGVIHLGDAHLALGQSRQAATRYREALAMLADMDHPDTEAVRSRLRRLEAPVPVEGR